MANNNQDRIDLLRKVYSKSEYTKIIDTEFNQLGQVSVADEEAQEVTVDQFFDYYNELFYEIPAEGETNSHAFLIKTSTEYINFDEINEEIAALRAEITSLREELLTVEKENANQIASISGNQVDELNEINSELNINTEETADTATGGAMIVGPGVVGGSVSSGGASSGGGGY